VKHHSAEEKIFHTIMRLKDHKIYKWIYKHPRISTLILALIAALILYIFISFVVKYVV